MFKPKQLLVVAVSAFLLTGLGHAAAPNGEYAGQIQLTPRVPEKGPDATSALPTNLPRPEQLEAERIQREREQQAAALPNPVDNGMPKVPASESATAAPASGDANFVVGQPVPTYATMEEAAAAGVDPYRVKGSPGIPQGESSTMESFDWTSLDSYLDWIAAHETNGLLALGAALFAVLVVVGLALRRAMSK